MPTAERILEIEEEFHAPFHSVLRSFAEAGHSMTDTAEILEMSRPMLSRLLKHMGWRHWFPNGQQSVRRRATDAHYRYTPARRAAQARALQARFERHAFELHGVRDTAAGHARRLGLSPKALRYRLKHNRPLTG